MLGRPQATARSIAAARRLKRWTRRRFGLGAAGPVLVAELRCGLPGCPPLETVVTFWPEPGAPHRFKVFKPLPEVCEADLPPGWMKPAIRVDLEDISCC